MATRNVLVKLLTDATGAKAGLRETSAELKRFGSYTAEATVKLQTEGVQAKLDRLNAQLKRYGEQPHTADVQIRMGNTARQIDRLELQLRQLTERPHEVKVGVNERSFLRVRERIGKLSFGDTVGRAGGAAFAAAGLGAGAFEAIKSVTEAYNTEQGAQARLQAQLGALNIDYETHAKRIDEVIQRTSQLSGLTGHDLTDAFTNIVRSTGNVSKSLHLVGLAADIARAKNIDVAKAGQLVAKVAAGSTSALGRYGIVIKKGATATEALGILQHKFGGQAEAYGKTQKGALDRVNVAFEHLREVIGAKLAPIITRAANAVAKFVTQMTNGRGAGGRFAATLKSIGSRIVAVVGFLNRHRQALGVAIAAWVTYRVVAGAAARITAIRTAGLILGIGKIAPAVGEAEAATVTGFAGMRAAAVSMLNPLTAILAALVAIHELKPGGDIKGFEANVRSKINAALAKQDRARVDPRLAGYPDGGASTASGRPQRTARAATQKKSTRQTLAQILAGIGSPGQVTAANLGLDLRQAEQAYAKAVRQHGANSPAAIQAAQAVIQAQQAITDSHKPASSASSGSGSRSGSGSGGSTRRTPRLGFGPDTTAKKLVTVGEELAKQLKANVHQNAALLPRLTDVAYHPVSGRMQHTPTRHGLGAAGAGGVHQTIHNNITTPGGIQYPDAEALAAALQRKLAAKGNG